MHVWKWGNTEPCGHVMCFEMGATLIAVAMSCACLEIRDCVVEVTYPHLCVIEFPKIFKIPSPFKKQRRS